MANFNCTAKEMRELIKDAADDDKLFFNEQVSMTFRVEKAAVPEDRPIPAIETKEIIPEPPPAA